MNIRTSMYPPIPLEKDLTGNYPFPNMPSGVLPFYLDEKNEIIWGCVESNRVGATVYAPPAGTQDIIVTLGELICKLEVAKPLPKLGFDFLKEFEGKSFSGKNYQEVVSLLFKNNFSVYLENPIQTAIHETYEEHGIDLRENIGINNGLVKNMFEFSPQEIKAKRGMTTQKIIAAELSGIEGVNLKFTNKIEQKIPVNMGHEFYEKGLWISLKTIKAKFTEEKLKHAEPSGLSKEQAELIQAELNAFESRIALLEKIERSMVKNLQGHNVQVNSLAGAEYLQFVQLGKIQKTHDTQVSNFHGRIFASKAGSAEQISPPKIDDQPHTLNRKV